MTRFKKITIILLLSLIPILKAKNTLFQKTNIANYEKSYSQSQYIMGEASPQKIDDDTLYIYAGYAYAKGEDPTTINFEHPPFGKYVFGLSYFLFQNSLLINILIYFFILWILLDIQKKLDIPSPFKYIPLILISTSGLFQDHLGRGLLDLQQLLYTLIFFNLLLSSKQRPIFLGGIVGIIASLKYPIPLMGLFALIIIIHGILGKKYKNTILTFVSAITVYLLSYSAYFLHNHSILDFIKFEWYRFKWWTGDRSMPKFLLLQTIFFGTFKSWWDENIYEVAKNFTRLWSVLLVGNILSIPKAIIFKRKSSYLTLYSSALLLLYLFGSAANERYLIQLIPFWLININLVLMSLFSRKNQPAPIPDKPKR